MPFPLQVPTTYVATTTPAIKAADLNSLLIYGSAAYTGAYSLSRTTFDGAGAIAQGAFTSDSPLAMFSDSQGQNLRSLVDHNGFPMGRYDWFDEQWQYPVTMGAAAGPTLFGTRPQWSATTTANATITQGAPVAAYPTYTEILTPGTANTNLAVLGTSAALIFPSTFLSTALEWEFTPNTSMANITWILGFNAVVDGTVSNTAAVSFQSTAGAAWQSNSNNNLNTLTGVPAPVVGTRQRFRVEYHGTATPIGIAAVEGLANTAKIRFFVNGTLYSGSGNQGTPPTVAFGVTFIGKATGAATGTGSIGPVRVAWNRFAAIDAL